MPPAYTDTFKTFNIECFKSKINEPLEPCGFTFLCPFKNRSAQLSTVPHHIKWLCDVSSEIFRTDLCKVKTAALESIESGVAMAPGIPAARTAPKWNSARDSWRKRNTRWTRHPHSCKYCPYSTDNKGHLERHVRTHTGEKPYICRICKMSFSDPSACSRHIRWHYNRGHTVEAGSVANGSYS